MMILYFIFPVIPPVPAASFQGCLILGVDTKWQHTSQSVDPVELYLEMYGQAWCTLCRQMYEVQDSDFKIFDTIMSWKVEVAAHILFKILPSN